MLSTNLTDMQILIGVGIKKVECQLLTVMEISYVTDTTVELTWFSLMLGIVMRSQLIGTVMQFITPITSKQNWQVALNSVFFYFLELFYG